MIADVLMKVAGMEQDFWTEGYRPRPSAAGQCVRALTYRRMGFAPEPLPDRTILVFDDGNWHEELTLSWLAKSAYRVHSQQMKVVCGTVGGEQVIGHIDGIIQDVAGVERLLEHKAINHFSFERYERLIETEAPLDPQDGYFIQVQLYLNDPTLRGMGIEEAVLLIKNKNTGAYCEFIIERDEAVARAALEKLEFVETCAGKNVAPPRPFNREVDWVCGYCRYARRCWEGYEASQDEGPKVVEDPEFSAMVDEYRSASSASTSAGKRKDEARAGIVRYLDALKTRRAIVGGLSVNWEKKFRTGYEVKTGEYWQLNVSKPRKA